MADNFQDELLALRKEVGDFVLEVLDSRTDRHVADEIAAGIAERLNRTLQPKLTLSEPDREALRNVQADVNELRRSMSAQLGRAADDVPTLSDNREPAIAGASHSHSRREGVAEANWHERPWARWTAGLIIAALVVGGGGALVAQRMGLFHRNSHTQVPSDDNGASSQSNDGPRPFTDPEQRAESRWRALLTTVDGMQGDKRKKAIRTLCGDKPLAQCPTFAERRAQLAKDPAEGQAAILLTLEAANARNDCSAPPASTQSAPSPQGHPVPPADVTNALWTCVLSEGDGG